ncbi:hypothetical protein JHK82_031899 [Glycine max]|uniref:Uncharacterized protein n=1 Tax=Glycine max TaxID=3847 RepID=A0A0R0HK14_SOYBN|nr:hypothetical protein JHK87_031829 [Glycine soja]KAG4989579.1 hypothetical protein JHK85_032562 [Glycine max]KAG4995169.1 hypothetical protein JHK86_031996 [Glycine max]KAG5125162.1 hypothetical protein JHK82_031899 [Glycine max]KAG5146587.1 hypothetical protein JHK84_032130 [Glycine max]
MLPYITAVAARRRIRIIFGIRENHEASFTNWYALAKLLVSNKARSVQVTLSCRSGSFHATLSSPFREREKMGDI